MKRAASKLPLRPRPCAGLVVLPSRPFTCSAERNRNARAPKRKPSSLSTRPSNTARASGVKPGAKASTSSSSNTYHYFRVLVQTHLRDVLAEFRTWNPRDPQLKAYGFENADELRRCVHAFSRDVERCFDLAILERTSRAENPLFWSLRYGFVRGSTSGLVKELRYAFRIFIGREKFSGGLPDAAKQLVDFRHPFEWYPDTRAMQRKIHLHVGPTNSGKTYNALKALEAARSGIFAGPLRLLAHEIYTRLTAKGRVCALVTGEEQRYPAKADNFIASCTVEMTPLNSRVDVAIIDEIQMLASPDRGWAWTQAFLGVQARELHLCGEERAVDLVRALCALTGEECIVHRYERLSPLETMSHSLDSDFRNLRKGDAVVAFSRINLHMLKSEIERKTGRRCAIVYGALPPETRAEQAALFNDPDNDYDFIVASDAIGMGLNLEIRRVIFDATDKFDGTQRRFLHVPEIKQIGGRAGRYRTATQELRQASLTAAATSSQTPSPAAADSPSSETTPAQSVGLVSCMQDSDLKRIQEAFEAEAPPLKAAGITPPAFIVERFMSYFPPETPLAFVLLMIRAMCTVSDDFFMCIIDNWIEVADIIEPFGMPISDRLIFLSAPLDKRHSPKLVGRLAKCISEMKGGKLLDIPEINLEMLDVDPAALEAEKGRSYSQRIHLENLEALHLDITLYLWLSYRFLGVFTSQRLAFHVKALVEEKIRIHLDSIDARPDRKERHEKIVRQLLKQMEEDERILSKEGLDPTGKEDDVDPPATPGEWHGEAMAGEADDEHAMESTSGSHVNPVAIQQKESPSDRAAVGVGG